MVLEMIVENAPINSQGASYMVTQNHALVYHG